MLPSSSAGNAISPLPERTEASAPPRCILGARPLRSPENARAATLSINCFERRRRPMCLLCINPKFMRTVVNTLSNVTPLLFGRKPLITRGK